MTSVSAGHIMKSRGDLYSFNDKITLALKEKEIKMVKYQSRRDTLSLIF